MGKRYYYIVLLLLSFLAVERVQAQGLSVKSNLLCDISGTLNFGLEYPLAQKQSLSLMTSYNPWEFKDNAKRKYILVQPEYRRWMRGVYDGYFVGFQANYASYNIGGKLPWWVASYDKLETNRYQGDLFGLGVTNGYQWVVSSRINIEAALSVGYAHCMYDKYPLETGATKIESGLHNYWGITQVGLTLVYIIN